MKVGHCTKEINLVNLQIINTSSIDPFMAW